MGSDLRLTIKLLDKHLPPLTRNAAAVDLLQQWIVEDEALRDEERDANAAVLRALDEDRLSDCKLLGNLAKDEPQ